MGATYSQHLSNDIGLFLLSGVVVVMLGNIWVNNMRDLFDTWKCRSNGQYVTTSNTSGDLQPTSKCRDPQTLAEFFVLSIFVSVVLYLVIIAYARFLNKFDETVDTSATARPA